MNADLNNLLGISSSIKDFIKRNLSRETPRIFLDGDTLYCYLNINGMEYSGRTEINGDGSIVLRRYLYSYYKIMAHDINIPNASKNYSKLVEDITSMGYEFHCVSPNGEYGDDYELTVRGEMLEEESLIKCLNLWLEYDRYLLRKLESAGK